MGYDLKTSRVAVVGLGYVGLPLALMLARHMSVTGFDISERRISQLQQGHDTNREIREPDLKASACRFTHDVKNIQDCNVYIVTVPTPIDKNNKPDLALLRSASKTVSACLKRGDIVVYESTVYPGVTEDICAPVLEEGSGLTCGKDFFLGYSPERINPGDAEHTVQKITKVVAGQTQEVTDFLAALYGSVNGGNIFKARDIRTAEAAKAIENAQRDINVAFINEVTMVLNRLGLSSHDVLSAASTKWNFLPFTPGLVGGHCIGVDPYYLAYCSQQVGHHPEVILAGRSINDSMGYFVADQVGSLLQKESRVLILGFTFKENINDIRNTKVIDIINRLKEKGHMIDIHDPHALAGDVKHEYGVDILSSLPDTAYDAIVLAVAHGAYREMNRTDIEKLLRNDGLVYDLKGIWKNGEISGIPRYKTL